MYLLKKQFSKKPRIVPNSRCELDLYARIHAITVVSNMIQRVVLSQEYVSALHKWFIVIKIIHTLFHPNWFQLIKSITVGLLKPWPWFNCDVNHIPNLSYLTWVFIFHVPFSSSGRKQSTGQWQNYREKLKNTHPGIVSLLSKKRTLQTTIVVSTHHACTN